MPRELLQQRARYAKASLGRLVGIGGGADGDPLAALHLPQVAPELRGDVLLGVNLTLEFQAIAQLHELVRVARVAILTGKLAAAVGIDRPGERHARRIAAIEDGARGDGEVFDVVALGERLALGCKTRDADKLRAGRLDGEETGLGEGGHNKPGYSLFVRL